VSWIVGLVWGAAALFAVVVLGVCGYELSWKSRRLSTDLRELLGVRDDLLALRDRLAAVQRRIPGR
jgi:hypothetical protein